MTAERPRLLYGQGSVMSQTKTATLPVSLSPRTSNVLCLLLVDLDQALAEACEKL